MKFSRTLNMCVFSFTLIAMEGHAGWLDEIRNKAVEAVESVKNSAKKIPLPGSPGKKTTSNTDSTENTASKTQPTANPKQVDANQKNETREETAPAKATQSSANDTVTVRFEQLKRYKEMLLHISYKGLKLRVSLPVGRPQIDQQWVKVNFASAAEGGPLYLDFESLQKIFNVKLEEFQGFYKGKVLANVSIKLGDQVLPLRIQAYKDGGKPVSVSYSLAGGTNDDGGPYSNGAFVMPPILDAIKANGNASITVTNSRNPDFNSNGPIPFDISALRLALLEKPKKIIAQDDGKKDAYIAALPSDIRNTKLVDYGDSQKRILAGGGNHQYINKHCFRAVYPYYYSSGYWKQIKNNIDYMNKTFFSSVSDSQRFNQSNVSSICNKTTTLTPKEQEVPAPYRPMAKLYYDKELSKVCSASNPTARPNGTIRSAGKQCLDPKLPAEQTYTNCKAGKGYSKKLTEKQCECLREKVRNWYASGKARDWGSNDYTRSNGSARFECRKGK